MGVITVKKVVNPSSVLEKANSYLAYMGMKVILLNGNLSVLRVNEQLLYFAINPDKIRKVVRRVKAHDYISDSDISDNEGDGYTDCGSDEEPFIELAIRKNNHPVSQQRKRVDSDSSIASSSSGSAATSSATSSDDEGEIKPAFLVSGMALTRPHMDCYDGNKEVDIDLDNILDLSKTRALYDLAMQSGAVDYRGFMLLRLPLSDAGAATSGKREISNIHISVNAGKMRVFSLVGEEYVDDRNAEHLNDIADHIDILFNLCNILPGDEKLQIDDWSLEFGFSGEQIKLTKNEQGQAVEYSFTSMPPEVAKLFLDGLISRDAASAYVSSSSSSDVVGACR
jgi:hypothetical protein